AGATAWALLDTGRAKPGPAPAPSAASPTGATTSSAAATAGPARGPHTPPAATWHKTLAGGMNASLLIAQGTAVVGSTAGIFAYAMKDGTDRWNKPDDSTTTLAGSGTTVAWDGAALVGVDAATGAVLWTFDPKPAAGATEQLAPGAVLAADDQAVYALCSFTPLDAQGNPDFSAKATPGIMAVDRSSGAVRWSQHRKPDADTTGIQAVLAGDQLLYTDSLQNLVSRSRSTGEQLWFVDTDSQGPYQPATDGQRIFCSTTGNGLQAVAIDTHRQAWAKLRPAGSHDLWYSDPAVANGVVYTVLGGLTLPQYGATPSAGPVLIAFRATDGQELWRLTLPNEVSMTAAPIVVQETLFVSTDNNGIYAVDTTARQIRWAFQDPLAVGAAWAFATDGHQLLAASGTRIYALPAA
ncbi:PQQ-binding-like beta-propeller repeat protein, partial [Kitasatospora sp. LaBMicrA B282]|uniref:outer membrane protein assembly factor BamB family protein n=1 Tax=Kitasatospora sp. LaBMicrA B282 TaxID=3420949 RepID=UPI003D098854